MCGRWVKKLGAEDGLVYARVCVCVCVCVFARALQALMVASCVLVAMDSD